MDISLEYLSKPQNRAEAEILAKTTNNLLLDCIRNFGIGAD